MGLSSHELDEKLRKIKVAVFDIDGVMTDGRIVYGNYGDEIKSFDAKDGFGLVLLKKSGIHTVFLTSRKSKINEKRAIELGVSWLIQDAKDKLKCLQDILKKWKVNKDQVSYMGDDWIDLPVLLSVGVSACPKDSVSEVASHVMFQSTLKAGRGAVREFCDRMLMAQGLTENLLKEYVGVR